MKFIRHAFQAHRLPMVLFALCTLLLPAQVRADPTTTAKFNLISSGQGLPPEVTLNGDVPVHIQGDTMPAGIGAATLHIDGSALGVAPRVDQVRHLLIFKLARTDDKDNRALWSRMLGSPLAQQKRTVPVSVELAGKPLDYGANPHSMDMSQTPQITLVTYNAGLMTLGLAFVALVIVGTSLMCCYTTMIRDATIPQLMRKDRSFSLGRTQMAFWFAIIFASFVFIGIVTFDSNSITPQSFILLGISSATALTAIAVDQSNAAHIKDVQASVTALGILTGDDVDRLAAAVNTTPNGPANAVIPGAVIGSNLAPNVTALWNEYRKRIVDVRSDGFLRDIVNDVNGPTIHRWQIVIWTLILGGVYVYSVYSTLETPNFDTNLLTLMGISGLTYVGFKIPEKQSTQSPG